MLYMQFITKLTNEKTVINYIHTCVYLLCFYNHCTYTHYTNKCTVTLRRVVLIIVSSTMISKLISIPVTKHTKKILLAEIYMHSVYERRTTYVCPYDFAVITFLIHCTKIYSILTFHNLHLMHSIV